MEAKTKKKLWIVLAVIVGIFVLVPSIPMIALFTLDSSEKSSNQKLEQKISERDFDGARELANKLSRDDDKEKAIERINKAQLSVMVVNNSLEDAQYLAQELDAMPEFFDVLEHNVQKIYERDFRGLYNMLTRFPITASYHAKLSDNCLDIYLQHAYDYAANHTSAYKEYYYSTNVGYNDEVERYNRLVEQVLDLAIFDGNKEYIRKLLPLFKPIAVENGKKATKKDSWGDQEYDILYKLENKAKADAQRKIKEAGINL